MRDCLLEGFQEGVDGTNEITDFVRATRGQPGGQVAVIVGDVVEITEDFSFRTLHTGAHQTAHQHRNDQPEHCRHCKRGERELECEGCFRRRFIRFLIQGREDTAFKLPCHTRNFRPKDIQLLGFDAHQNTLLFQHLLNAGPVGFQLLDDGIEVHLNEFRPVFSINQFQCIRKVLDGPSQCLLRILVASRQIALSSHSHDQRIVQELFQASS